MYGLSQAQGGPGKNFLDRERSSPSQIAHLALNEHCCARIFAVLKRHTRWLPLEGRGIVRVVRKTSYQQARKVEPAKVAASQD